jgi:hypothetical protein
MAYSTTNPPRLTMPKMGGPLAANSTSVAGGGACWFYRSSADLTSNLCTPGYFTNGKDLGMRPGDLIDGVVTSTESSTGYIRFSGVVATTNSSAGYNLSTDSMITSTFS